jgi:hypothetical protein
MPAIADADTKAKTIPDPTPTMSSPGSRSPAYAAEGSARAQMPQLELGMGVKGFNVAGNVTLVGTTQIATFGAGCDTRKMRILGTSGAKASFFGLSSTLLSQTLFDKTIQAAYPTGCGVAP